MEHLCAAGRALSLSGRRLGLLEVPFVLVHSLAVVPEDSSHLGPQLVPHSLPLTVQGAVLVAWWPECAGRRQRRL